MALWNAILELPMGGTVLGMIIYLFPVWVAFFLGILVGWAWKPRWAALGNCKSDVSVTSSPSTSVNPSNFGASSRNNVIENEPIPSPCTVMSRYYFPSEFNMFLSFSLVYLFFFFFPLLFCFDG